MVIHTHFDKEDDPNRILRLYDVEGLNWKTHHLLAYLLTTYAESSMEELEIRMGVGREAVYRAVRKLEQLGLLTRVPQLPGRQAVWHVYNTVQQVGLYRNRAL